MRRSAAAPDTAVDGNVDGAADRRASAIQLEYNQLHDDDDETRAIVLRLPSPSDTVDRALSRYFAEQPAYADLEATLGPDWSSRLYFRHRIGHSGQGDDPPLVPLRELSWRPHVANGVAVPVPRPDQFDIIHYDPQAGVTTVSPVLNAPEEKRRLTSSFIDALKAQYTREQDTYWSTPANGSTPARDLRRTLTSALRTEASVRLHTGTLSAQAADIARAVVKGPVEGEVGEVSVSSDAGEAIQARVRRLTWKGAPVPGAFVFTRAGSGDPSGPALLWRPGRPLQEFTSEEELKRWVAGENAAPGMPPAAFRAEDAGLAPANGNVFALREQDMRERMQARFTAALTDDPRGVPLPDHLDNAFDPLADLDLSHALDGEQTEGLRQKLGSAADPRQIARLETLRQAALRSDLTLSTLAAQIPSLESFTKVLIQRKFAKDYPGAAQIDPDRTEVHHKVIRRTNGMGGPVGSDEMLNNGISSLTDFAKHYAPPSPIPLVIGNPVSPIIATTVELVDGVPVDADGKAILDKSGIPMHLETSDVQSLVKDLDADDKYHRMLLEWLASPPRDGRARQMRAAWIEAARDRMRAESAQAALDPAIRSTFVNDSRGAPGSSRALDYLHAVIEHPDPASRPRVDGQQVVANRLVLGAASAAGSGGGGQTITGVVVIGSAAPATSPAVVLYTPDAPDGRPFRELADVSQVVDLARQPEWKGYFTERMSTGKTAETERILSGRGSAAGQVVLAPMTGDFYEERYKEASGFMISHALHRSKAAQDEGPSLVEMGMFGLEVLTSLTPLLGLRGGQRTLGGRNSFGAGYRPGPQRPAVPRTATPRLPVEQGWQSWSSRDPALASRLTQGNMGPGGMHYRRDPVTGKEYLNIGGQYYRGEYRGGKHVIFNDRNVSESREVLASSGALFVGAASGGLRGGMRVPDHVLKEMRKLPVFRGSTPQFRERYYGRLRELINNNGTISKLLVNVGGNNGPVNDLYLRRHNDALAIARSAEPVAGASGTQRRTLSAAGFGQRPTSSAAGSARRPAPQPTSGSDAASPSKRPRPTSSRPTSSGPNKGHAPSTTRVEITGAKLEEMKRRPFYRYLQSEKLSRERATGFVEFSSRDVGGKKGTSDGIIYFTDIPPDDMQREPTLADIIFGKTKYGGTRMNKIEAVQEVNLENLPTGTKIYRESPHIYTIDRRTSVSTPEMGLQFGRAGPKSWIRRYWQKLGTSTTYTEVTKTSALPTPAPPPAPARPLVPPPRPPARPEPPRPLPWDQREPEEARFRGLPRY